jgi:hypothetical protein
VDRELRPLKQLCEKKVPDMGNPVKVFCHSRFHKDLSSSEVLLLQEKELKDALESYNE